MDSSDMPLLICGSMFAGVLSLAASSGTPSGAAITLDTTHLPPIPAAEEPGGEPLQTEVYTYTVDVSEGFQAELLHAYSIDGLVVSRRAFRGRGVNRISPFDLGIVWGELAEREALDSLRFITGRWVLNTRYDDPSLLPEGWEQQITNNHLIPASDAVREALLDESSVAGHQRIRLIGYLVNVTGDTIGPWRSSTTRDDSSIVSGCEIILVLGVEVFS